LQPLVPEMLGLPKPGAVLLGKYRVDRVIGVGGMGAVVSARHLQLDEKVAIKLLLPHMLDNEEVVQRFLREARAAIKIRSEHCVRVLDVGTLDNGAPYMVMEFLEGEDLAAIVARRAALSIPDVIDWVLQAAEPTGRRASRCSTSGSRSRRPAAPTPA
jgi:serine/threonine protein kinase